VSDDRLPRRGRIAVRRGRMIPFAPMRLNLPNSLTLFRIFLVPLLVVVLLTPPWATAWVKGKVEGVQYAHWLVGVVAWLSDWREIVGVVIFLVAASTDWLDGFLARRRGQVTTLGQLLDPIADKLLTVSAFISLVELRFAPAWMIVVIVGREFMVSGMRSIAATRGTVIPASPWGKFKTASQVLAISLLILTRTLDRWGFLGVVALWLVMLLALVSAADYFHRFLREVDLGAAS
jgi:CDP-diacylglycerol--glycerol-3-phosphate 3-phosphatidyltransferase